MLLCQFISWLMFFFQDDVPPIYQELFNAQTIVNIVAIVGAVKLVRNPFNLKGFWAVVVTIVVSLLYGALQFGFAPGGLTKGLILGALAAGSFYITKNVGTILSAYGIGNLKKVMPDVVKFIKEHPDLMKKILLGLKYIFFRK